MKRIAIVGAGASGCLSAVLVKRSHPNYDVVVFESGPRPMAKLALTGGGRCNITNTFENVDELKKVYPRGAQLLKKAYYEFGPQQTFDWWESQGIRLCVEQGGRVFPCSQDAMQVVDKLRSLMHEAGVDLRCSCKVTALKPSDTGYVLTCADGREESFDKVLVSSGGGALNMLPADIEIEPCVPSLFTFKLDCQELKALMGISAPQVELLLAGTKFKSNGALLVTDWGVSGPAVLALSSFAARYLSEQQYRGFLIVNWLSSSQNEAMNWLETQSKVNGGKLISNVHPEQLSQRLWDFLLSRAGLRPDQRWSELGSKGKTRLLSVLCCDTYQITGRAKFKDEFVTCGGVSLKEVDASTLESKKYPGLFFAGEMLDIDALTGGFNLQAAWTTAYLASRGI